MLRRPDLSKFDEAAAGDAGDGVFGLPFSAEESSVVLIPAPWEPTTSYGKGTSRGPLAIRAASAQLDLFDPDLSEQGLGSPWRFGIHMLEPSGEHEQWNLEAAESAAQAITSSSSASRLAA
ncbi:MAG: arginase family protein, partial [Nannocystaceae bacterium]